MLPVKYLRLSVLKNATSDVTKTTPIGMLITTLITALLHWLKRDHWYKSHPHWKFNASWDSNVFYQSETINPHFKTLLVL